ncbi:MAG: hypothetical protein ACI8ZN_001776 [Bacteroidia bacterium]|jgi:uncharacterized protein with NRDE domain
MCTVTYVPNSNQGFILTSNRDESVKRGLALPPRAYYVHNQYITFPKDPKAGGTWLAVSNNFLLCLLNGAEKKHVHQSSYRKSRGLVMLEFFEYNSPSEYTSKGNFSNIEPFTLVIVQKPDVIIHQFRWDGSKASLIKLDSDQNHIWSSSTLYEASVISARQAWFSKFLSAHLQQPVAQNLMDFHLFGGNGDSRNDLVMQRNEHLKTVSITQYIQTNLSGRLVYNDLITKEVKELSI